MRLQSARNLKRANVKGWVTTVVGLLTTMTLVTILASRAEAGTKKGELHLAPALTRELNLALKAGDALHKALISKDEEEVEMSLHDLISQLDHTKQSLGFAKIYERGHLRRILDAAEEHFEVTRRAIGEERRTHLADGFNQLVNLVRIYDLDRSYAIYFCPKDRTTWVQRGNRGANPFEITEGHREPCSIRVPR